MCLADLLADEEWRAEVEVLDAELHRLALPNDRLRLRFGEALSKLGRRFRDLGFRRLDLYVRERASRPGRWGAGSRLVAERLERFARLRKACRAGEISWSMAELLARSLERVASASPGTETDDGRHLAEEEAELLAIARGSTVREMRALLRNRLSEREDRIEKPGGRNPSDPVAEEEEADDDRIWVRRLLPAHQAMTLEMTLRVIQHMSGGSTGDAFEWLLTEAQTSLIPQVPPELDYIAEDIEARFLDRARRRAEALAETERDEAVAERDIAQARGAPSTGEDTVEDDDHMFGPLPDELGALDRVIRELGFHIASAELYRGWTLTQFLARCGWAILGYVSETQYARERLGMSRAEMYRQARLARDCQRLSAIRDAVRAGTLGSSHAGLLVRVATPQTEQAWLERAKRRTVKHLKEEVDAVERVRRYVTDSDDTLAPPTEAEMALIHAVDREVLTGRALRRALGISRPDLDGQSEEEPSRPVRPSFRTYRDVFERATTYGLESSGSQATGAGSSKVTDVEIATENSESSGEEFGPPISTSVSSEPQPRPKAAVPWSESLRSDVLMFFQQLEALHRAAGLGGSFLDFALKDFLETWTPHLGKSDVWEHVYRRYRYRCSSPVCDSKNVTLHHIQYRAHGGDDSDENLTTPCDHCHLEGEHGGTLRVFPPASRPTYVLGSPQVMVVEGREVLSPRRREAVPAPPTLKLRIPPHGLCCSTPATAAHTIIS